MLRCKSILCLQISITCHTNVSLFLSVTWCTSYFLKHAELIVLPHKALWLFADCFHTLVCFYCQTFGWCKYIWCNLWHGPTAGYFTFASLGLIITSGALDVVQLLCRYSDNTGFSSGYWEQQDLWEQLCSWQNLSKNVPNYKWWREKNQQKKKKNSPCFWWPRCFLAAGQNQTYFWGYWDIEVVCFMKRKKISIMLQQ